MVSRSVQYKVVVDSKKQYSLIPVSQSVPSGMREAGKVGTATECLNYIEEVWTDMTLMEKQRLRKSFGG